jgi:hypothetical protein
MTLHGRPYQPPGMKHFDPATIHWSVGGKACVLDWDSFEATAPGGYGQLIAEAKPERGRRRRIKQGDHVIGKKPNGSVVYEGRVDQPPKYVDDVAHIVAMGPRTVLDGYNDRLPYQIRDASQWQELHADPATFASNSPKFQIAQKGNTIGIQTQQGQQYNNGDNQGYYAWVQGFDIQNLQFVLRKTVSNTNLDLRVRRSDDDFSAPTTVTTISMGGGGPADGTARDVDIAANASVVIIDWNANANDTPANNQRFWAQAIRIGVLTDQDVFTSSEVAQDVGRRCGYQVSAVGATNMMPLDWNSPATDLLNYLADIEDQTWLVMSSDRRGTYGRLIFRDWGHKVWRTHLGEWAEDQGLECQKLYNRATTTYQNPPGVQQSVRSAPEDFGLKDPLPHQQEDYPDILQLEDPQADDGLARAVNAKVLAKVTKLRVKGNLRVVYTKKGVPFDIEPGDAIKIGGFQPDVPPQRIAAVNYQKDGSVVLSLGIDYNLAALVDQRITRHLKRRNRRR